MKDFDFCVEVCLGYHCNGCGEYAYGDGTVRLGDEQVDRLVAIIRENSGETDVEALGLAEKCPDIYEALDNAYWAAAEEACHRHWVIYGFENGFLEEPDDLMESLEEAGLFLYEPELCESDEEEEVDEDAKADAFAEWLDEYVDSLSESEKVSFIETYYGGLEDDGDAAMGDYVIEIPDEIIKMALGH